MAAGNARIISVVEPAVIPYKKYRPNPVKYLAIAFALGLFGGLLLVFLHEFLDGTIKSSIFLEQLTGIPIGGVIPCVSSNGVGKIVKPVRQVLEAPTSAFSEAYR